jgi:hypothetical protein
MRARSLKPGFFKNELLAELPFGARLLFEGLWLMADRAGRLEERVKRISAELFAYDQVPTAKWLEELARLGFIVRYQADGKNYIAVRKWSKHQNPHHREPESVIPPPPGNGAARPGAESKAEPESKPEARPGAKQEAQPC